MPWVTANHCCFLLVVDMFSKNVETIALRDHYAEGICVAFNLGRIHRHSRFKVAVSDYTKNVDGSVVTQIWKEMRRKETFFSIPPRRERF